MEANLEMLGGLTERRIYRKSNRMVLLQDRLRPLNMGTLVAGPQSQDEFPEDQESVFSENSVIQTLSASMDQSPLKRHSFNDLKALSTPMEGCMRVSHSADFAQLLASYGDETTQDISSGTRRRNYSSKDAVLAQTPGTTPCLAVEESVFEGDEVAASA
jgi:hypothetical protein